MNAVTERYTLTSEELERHADEAIMSAPAVATLHPEFQGLLRRVGLAR